MAKTKQAASKARQKTKPAGKRLGLKVGDQEMVKTGQILMRQHGTKIHPGEGVGLGRDYTLFALRDGRVQFGDLRDGRKKVSVLV